MKKRICSLLLICSMLAGLLPQIVLPQARQRILQQQQTALVCPRKKKRA